jgi:hypothetical protein
MSEWIKVKDKKPQLGRNHLYLFVNGKRDVTFGYAFDFEDENRVWINDMERETNEIATHWMELPALPELPITKEKS